MELQFLPHPVRCMTLFCFRVWHQSGGVESRNKNACCETDWCGCLYIKKCEGIFNRPPPSIAIRCWLKFRQRAFNLFEGNVMLGMIFTTQQDPQEKTKQMQNSWLQTFQFSSISKFCWIDNLISKIAAKTTIFCPIKYRQRCYSEDDFCLLLFSILFNFTTK